MNDLDAALTHLRLEKMKLDRVIKALELLESQPLMIPSTRGRKSMSEVERRAVSERMKRFWEGRRNVERRIGDGLEGAVPISGGSEG